MRTFHVIRILSRGLVLARARLESSKFCCRVKSPSFEHPVPHNIAVESRLCPFSYDAFEHRPTGRVRL